MKTEKEFIYEVVQPLRKFVNENPELLSILYDVDLCPEQIVKGVNAVRLMAFCTLYKRYLANQEEEKQEGGDHVYEQNSSATSAASS